MGSVQQTLPDVFEEELATHVLDMQSRFFSLPGEDVRKLAYSLAVNDNLNHPFGCVKQMAGRECWSLIISRHPELSLKKPEATSLAWAVGFNKPQADRFFTIWNEQLDKGFEAARIWNMDRGDLTAVHIPPMGSCWTRPNTSRQSQFWREGEDSDCSLCS